MNAERSSRMSGQELYTQALTDAVVEDLLRDARRLLNVDTAAILLFDASGQFLVATAAVGIEEEVREGSRVRPGDGFAGKIAVERRPVILDEVTDSNVVNPLLLRRGIASMLGIPLIAAQDHSAELLGVMHVGSLTPRRFDNDDVAALQQLGVRVAAAVTAHRTFVDRAAAVALQTSLASRLPDIPGLDLAARYVAGSQYGVGGDWYDVFPLPTGQVGVTIGDVMGHGLRAATVMGRMRSALRAYALDYAQPATVLERLDRKMRHFEPGLIATVGYAVLDPVTGRMQISSAGHLPPIVLTPTSTGHLLELPVDPPIGVVSSRARRATEVHLDVGMTACFYTDGLVERRTFDITEQLDLLCQVASYSPPDSVEKLCADIMSGMLHDRTPDDDVSLLVVSLN